MRQKKGLSGAELWKMTLKATWATFLSMTFDASGRSGQWIAARLHLYPGTRRTFNKAKSLLVLFSRRLKTIHPAAKLLQSSPDKSSLAADAHAEMLRRFKERTRHDRDLKIGAQHFRQLLDTPSLELWKSDRPVLGPDYL